MTRQDLLKTVEDWMVQASDPTKNDIELVIKRVGILTRPDGQPEGVRFAIEARALLGVWDEVQSSRIQRVTLVPKEH